jgi:fucose permease
MRQPGPRTFAAAGIGPYNPHAMVTSGASARAIRMAHAAFVLTGAVTTLLGPLLPVLVDRWALDDAQAGAFFTAQFAGSMCGVALSASLGARGFERAIASGLLLMAVGVGGLWTAGWPWALLLVTCYGVGLGLAIPATNLLVADSAPARRSAALNILNLAWGIGAVATPPALGWLAARGRADAFIACLAIALLLAGGAMVVSTGHEPSAGCRKKTDARAQAVPWRSPAFAVFALLFFLYVGTENAIAGWVAVHAHRIDPSPVALSTPSFFWGALLAGRALAPALLARTTELRLIVAGLATAAIGVGSLLLASGMTGVFASVTLCGLGLAAVFPTTIAQLSRAFGDASARAAAAAFLMAGFGGATLPPLVGLISEATGALRVGLVVPLLGCALMIVLHSYGTRLGMANGAGQSELRSPRMP